MFRSELQKMTVDGTAISAWRAWYSKSANAAFLIGLCLLQACVQGVSGRIRNSDETFSGRAVTEMSDRQGTIQVSSSKGLSCRGHFVYLTADAARGAMRCEDGRFGPLEIVRDASGANGYCKLGGEDFLFTIGR